MEKIIEGIKGEIAHAESLKEQYPKMDSQDVINLLQKIVDLLESESPEPEGEKCPRCGKKMKPECRDIMCLMKKIDEMK